MQVSTLIPKSRIPPPPPHPAPRRAAGAAPGPHQHNSGTSTSLFPPPTPSVLGAPRPAHSKNSNSPSSPLGLISQLVSQIPLTPKRRIPRLGIIIKANIQGRRYRVPTFAIPTATRPSPFLSRVICLERRTSSLLTRSPLAVTLPHPPPPAAHRLRLRASAAATARPAGVPAARPAAPPRRTPPAARPGRSPLFLQLHSLFHSPSPRALGGRGEGAGGWGGPPPARSATALAPQGGTPAAAALRALGSPRASGGRRPGPTHRERAQCGGRRAPGLRGGTRPRRGSLPRYLARRGEPGAHSSRRCCFATLAAILTQPRSLPQPGGRAQAAPAPAPPPSGRSEDRLPPPAGPGSRFGRAS